MNFPSNNSYQKYLHYPSANIYNKYQTNPNRNNQNNQPISQVVPVQKSLNINSQKYTINKSITKPKNNYIHNGINQYENPPQLHYINEYINNEINFSNYVNNKNIKPQNKNKKNIQNNINNTNNLIERKKIFSQTLRENNKRPILKHNKTPKKFSNKSQTQSKKINENLKKNKNFKSNPNFNTKKMCVDQLIKNGVNNEIHKYKPNKMTNKQMLVERKKKIVEEYGTNINDISSDENNNMEFSENKKYEDIVYEMSGNNLEKLPDLRNDEMKMNYKTTRDFFNPKQNNYLLYDEYLDETNPKTLNNNKVLKPKVNQFEFIKKIKNEQKKLPTYIDNQADSNLNLNNNTNNNTNHTNQTNNTNDYFQNKINGGPKKNLKSELNDSFRHKNNLRNKNNVNNKQYNNNYIHNKNNYHNHKYNHNQNSKNILVHNENNNFSYNDKKNHRSSDEIRRYLCEKKNQNKEEENNKMIEKNKKLFLKYKDLYMLNMKESHNLNNKNNPNSKSENNFCINNINNYFNENYFTKIQSKSPNALRVNAHNLGNNSQKKRKEVNEYYIGGDSTLKNNNNTNTNNNSTLIELNEYYLNVLESQQLFVNSNLNKIENISQLESENEQNEQNDNINNNNTNNNNGNNSLLKSEKFEEIRKQIANTLKRANKLFSRNDSGSTITLNEDKNSNINTNNKDNENGKINNENENSKIKKNKIPEINIVSSNIEHLDNKLIDNTNENLNSNSNKNTKEKVLPSLSHTFTTNSNNPNKKIEVGIEPRSVLNLVEILKFIIQRKIFVKLYESYINRALNQQYVIAFSYFIAICKHYPFKKIEEYCNYKMYNMAFRQLFKPFIRKNFNKFIENLNYSKKIKLLELVLRHLLKKNVLKKIEEYAEFGYESEAQNKLIEQAILHIMKKLINPHLKIVFKELLNYDKKKLEKKSDSKSPLHKRANDYICSNSYLYESLESSSSNLSVHDINSENNDKLHQYREKIKRLKELYLENNSKSSKSLNENLSKSFSDFLDENKNNDDGFKKFNNSLKEKENNNNDSIDMEKDLPEDIKELLKHNIKSGKKNSDNEEEDVLKLKHIRKRNSDNDVNIQDELFLEQDSDIHSDKNLNNKNEKSRNLKLDNIEVDLDIEKNEKEVIKNDYVKQESDEIVNIENKEDKEKIENKEKKEDKEKTENKEKKENKEKTENKEKKENKEKIEKKEKIENIKENENKEIIKKEEVKKEEVKKEEEKKEENIRPEHLEKLNNILSQKIIPKKDFEKFALELTEDIITKTLFNEITKKKLIPTKKFKYDKFLKMNSHNPLSNSLNNSYGSMGGGHDSFSKDYGLGSLSHLSLADDLNSLNDSMMTSYSFNSYFNKTIKDKKKQNNMFFYLKYVAPRFIKVIKLEIIKNYSKIYDSISTPIHNDSKNIIIAIALQDLDLYRESYKNKKNYEKIEKILDVKKIIQNFEPINKKIRKFCPFNIDINYDNMLNECLLETAIELINDERLYGNNGEPLKWSSRTHELKFKYNKNDPNKLADYVCQNLLKDLCDKVGLIKDNCDNMSPEQINIERDKRLTNVIKNELDNYEKSWNNLEIEETQLKVDSTEVIMMQLYNEVIEILEHISYSRVRPDLYQYKSIYACEEIPRLDFQVTTTEEATVEDVGENDVINI